LQWELLQCPEHSALQRWLSALNRFYRGEPALYEWDCDPAGFAWVDANDSELSVISFLRQAHSNDDVILVVCNFTPVVRHNYRVGVPRGGFWRELLNSDAAEHGGSGQGNLGGVEASPISFHGRANSVNLTLPPLGVIFLKSERDEHNFTIA
jgi:1,4-alpha-glucan branching enzyme